MTTLVTGFIDLGRRESRPGRGWDEYRERARWLLAQPYPMVIYSERDRQAEARALRPAGLPTVWRDTAPEDLLAWGERDRVRTCMRAARGGWNEDKDTPAYLALTWHKTEWMRQAVQANPFGTDSFAWVDFGMTSTLGPAVLDEALARAAGPPAPPRLRMCALAYVEPAAFASRATYYGTYRYPIAATFFAGPGADLVWLADQVRAEWRACLDEGVAGLEEMIFGVIAHRHPERFERHYGDYQSLLANYSAARFSHAWILENVAASRAAGDHAASLARLQAIHDHVDRGDAHLWGRFLEEWYVANWHTGRHTEARRALGLMAAGLVAPAPVSEPAPEPRATTGAAPRARSAPARQSPLTLVTGLYDLAVREPALRRRPTVTYLRLYEYLRTVPLPMVVCAEPHCLEAVRDRACAGPRQFVEVRLEESRYYDRMPELSQLRRMENAIHKRDTPLGFVAVSAKFDLMARASETNPFDTSAFAWIDWGGRHVMETPADWGALATTVAERVVPRDLALLVSMKGASRAVLEPRSEFYRWNRGLVAATFFAGTARGLTRLRDRYTDEVERMIASGYLGMEEQVMGALAALHPWELTFTYSDYVGILANIGGVTRDVGTVLANLAACGEAGLHQMAVDIGRQVLSSLTSGRLRLEAPEAEKLLFWLFVSAFYAARPLADDLALAAVMLHAEIPLAREQIDRRRELWNLNLSFVGRRLGDVPMGWTDFLRSPAAEPWLGLL